MSRISQNQGYHFGGYRAYVRVYRDIEGYIGFKVLGFPKIWGILLGVPIVRTTIFWGPILGSPYSGKLPCGPLGPTQA